jgi:uncharacterized protein (DUF885 family)
VRGDAAVRELADQVWERVLDRDPVAALRCRGGQVDASLSGLTYGYYEPPSTGSAGYYHYNTANLPSRPLLQAASVIYHEGLPGHHMQMGRLAENTALHPIRRQMTELRTFALSGYLEGWAEYGRPVRTVVVGAFSGGTARGRHRAQRTRLAARAGCGLPARQRIPC